MHSEPRIVFIRRNYYLMMLESAVFWIASAFFDSNTVVNVFIAECTGSLQLAGLTSSIKTVASVVGQFVAGPVLLGALGNQPFMGRSGFLSRPVYLLLIPVLLLWGAGPAAAFVLVGCMTAFFIGDGFVSLAWNSIAASTIPDDRRGQMMAYAQTIAGCGSLAAGFFVSFLLRQEQLAPNLRYAAVFGCGACVYILNAVVLSRIRDRDRSAAAQVRPPRPRLGEYVARFLPVWRSSRHFRRINLGRLLFQFAIMGSTLIVLFGRRSIGLTGAQTSSMVYIQMAGLLVGGLFWGKLASRASTFTLMGGVNVCAIITASLGLVVIAMPDAGAALYLLCAMVFLTGFNSMGWIGFSNEIFRIAPESDRVVMLVIHSLIQLISAFAPYLASLVAEKTSYLPVFALSVAFGAAGLVLNEVCRRTAPPNAVN